MGKVKTTFYDKLIPETPDRNPNRVRVYEKENGEVVIHFRNLKITLFTEMEIKEWKEGFKEALELVRQHDYLKNDL